MYKNRWRFEKSRWFIKITIMKKVYFLSLLFFGLLLSGGCRKDPNVIFIDQQKEIQDFLITKGWQADAIPTADSSIWYIIDEVGTGVDFPDSASTVTVKYEGFLLDETKFDSSIDRGQDFTSSLQNVIEGWEIGIPKFKKGGRGKLFIPSKYGYGNSRQGLIPRNSVLYFEIELVDFN
jgi:FKBP-type peptidyl-prolyl cis-trans isomerase